MIDDLAPLRLASLGIVLGKRFGKEGGRDDAPSGLAACANALRMKSKQQRCQLDLSTFATVAFIPSWASDMTSLTPLGGTPGEWNGNHNDQALLMLGVPA
ncbi:hypothetical protein ABIA94_009041 [Bradyrhizobium sp. LA7.1]